MLKEHSNRIPKHFPLLLVGLYEEDENRLDHLPPKDLPCSWHLLPFQHTPDVFVGPVPLPHSWRKTLWRMDKTYVQDLHDLTLIFIFKFYFCFYLLTNSLNTLNTGNPKAEGLVLNGLNDSMLSRGQERLISISQLRDMCSGISDLSCPLYLWGSLPWLKEHASLKLSLI